jgi:flagellar protein FliS
MSFAFARSRYRQADTIFQENATKPYDVVFVTLKELSRALGVLAAAQESSRPLPTDHVNRALTAIYILQSSLDFELGGEIAGDLFQLYEFARFHVLKAWRDESDARLREAADAMADILEAWKEIGPQLETASE